MDLGGAFNVALGVFAEHLVKAQGKKPAGDTEGLVDQAGPVFQAAAERARSLLIDPYAWHQGDQGHYQRPTLLGWNTLRRMAGTPLLGAVIKTRLDQSGRFFRPQDNQYLPGFRVRLRSTRRAPRRTELRMIESLEQFLLQCGTLEDARQAQHRDGFKAFGKKVLRDSLTFDQGCAEILPAKEHRFGGPPKPAAMKAVDAGTIRIAQTTLDGHGLPDDDYDTPRYVQVYEETVVNEYTASRMMFGIRNPQSALQFNGYGMSELEMMVRVVTAWLNAFDHNYRAFTQGISTKGILNFKGTQASEGQINAFKRDLQLLLAGVAGAHRMPVTQSDGLEFLNLNPTTDLEWSGWMDVLIKLACALFGIDPAEINFVYGNTGQAGAMGGASIEEKIAASKDRGLAPLIEALFEWLNLWVIWPLDPDFEVVPTGLSTRGEDEDLDLAIKRVQHVMTVNEARRRLDLPDLPGKAGEVILNPTYLQHQQMAQGEQAGAGDAEPVDTGDLFGTEPTDTGTAAEDAGTETPDVIPDRQPLAASLTARRLYRRRVTLNL